MILSALFCALGSAQTPAADLRIMVVEGEGAINNVRQHRAKDPVVRVLDGSGAPVAGASVTFILPEAGASGEFGGGVRMLAIVTDEKGEAAGKGLVPNQNVGRFQIRVVASSHGATANAFIDQTNAEPATASRGPSKKLLVIAAIGGAAAAGVALAARGGGGAATSPTQPATGGTAIVIAPGTPGFQPPH